MTSAVRCGREGGIRTATLAVREAVVVGDVPAQLERRVHAPARLANSDRLACFALGLRAGALVALVQLLDGSPPQQRDRQRERKSQRCREEPPRADVRPRCRERRVWVLEAAGADDGAGGAPHLKTNARRCEPGPRESKRGEDRERGPRGPRESREREPADDGGRADEHTGRDREEREVRRGRPRRRRRFVSALMSTPSRSRTWTRPMRPRPRRGRAGARARRST